MARSQVLERLSFATAPALYAALWLSAGIVLAPYYWIAPGVLITATLLLALISSIAARTAVRVALLPLAFTWLLLGGLLSEIEPAPNPQSQLSLIADAGGAPTVDGMVTRTTPVRLTQSTLPFGNISREEQSESLDLRIASVDGHPVAGGLRATIYSPVDQLFPNFHCGDQIDARIAMHLPERYLDPGVWDATAWLRQQGIGVVGSLKLSALTLTPARSRRWIRLLASFHATGRKPAADRLRRRLHCIAVAAMVASQPPGRGHAERDDPWRPHLPES